VEAKAGVEVVTIEDEDEDDGSELSPAPSREEMT